MIHVDIRTDKNTGDCIAETSVDGSTWKRLVTAPVTIGDPPGTADRAVREYVRAWIDGARFAGAEVRATAYGYPI